MPARRRRRGTAGPDASRSLAAIAFERLRRWSLLDGTGEVRPLEEIEAEVIRFAISHYRGQMSEVARRLHIGRSTLYRKLDALGLDTATAGSLANPL